ncbi:hypothetical protein [Candidatus Methylocalor cossyra]|uniref:Uncharacterized protein n=1 Tax=Candidatus Methylocalor cossyra TaxID=3108543 RepID=A0ABM9NL40_9GAMM
MKTALSIVVSLTAIGHGASALAYDSGPQTLGPAPGATDYYRITCASVGTGDTDHLNFQVTDTTALPAELPVLNLRVVKDNLTAEASGIGPGKSKQLVLQGGNGKYKVSLNTAGTDPTLNPKQARQSYALTFQCLNGNDQPTRTSAKGSAGRIAKNGTKNYPVKCARHKKTGDTDKLLVTLSNTTRSGQSSLLMAQLVQGSSAINATDGNPVSFRNGSAKNGNGDYFLTVNHTGTGAAKQYTFSAACANPSGAEVVEPIVEVLQDQ